MGSMQRLRPSKGSLHLRELQWVFVLSSNILKTLIKGDNGHIALYLIADTPT